MQEINKIIDKHRFRTLNKIIAVIRKDSRFDNIPDKEIRAIIQKRIHDMRPNSVYKRIYQVKIFSRFRNSYFMDLYDNLEGNEPRYWQIFINTNTRYAVALPLPDKTKDSIHSNLKQFVEQYRPRKITSDEEPGLCSKINIDYLRENKCGLYIITEKQHSSLGIIDRFIRTLRDMNTPQEKPVREQSTDKQFTYISPDENKRMGNTLGTNRGVIEKVLGRAGPNKVRVQFKMPDGSKYEDTINITELRMPFPQFKSSFE